MSNILEFYVNSRPSFQHAMHELYSLYPDGKPYGYGLKKIFQVACGHFVPNIPDSELFATQFPDQCECREQGCANCTLTRCVFLCALCDLAVTPITSLHVVQVNGVTNWLGVAPRKPTYGDGCGDGCGESVIVRKRKLPRVEAETNMPHSKSACLTLQ